ncbi:MAG: dihydroneopterin aldolase [Rickettsiales bacterium]|nr:dihydroneopterin aldolase [Rickettsiales bacterium]
MIIKIKNLTVNTIIGIYDWEKKVDRKIVINVELTTNFTKSTQSDDISDAIDYDEIIKKIKDLVANNRFQLIEKMAQSMMNVILSDQRINKCKLEIDKVGVVEALDSFSVTLEQENNNGR